MTDAVTEAATTTPSFGREGEEHAGTGWRAALDDLPPNARVVVRCPSRRTLADVVCAVLDRRLVAVPLGPRTPDDELHRVVGRMSASLVVDGVGPTPIATDVGDPEHPEAAGLAFVMSTSGSTGDPKGVMLDRASVVGNATKVARLHGFSPDRPHATCLPMHHVNALMMSLLGTRVTGAPLTLCERFDPHGYFERIGADGARTASIVPALLHELLEVRPEWPESLEYLITAAAPLGSDLAERFLRAYGPRLRQGYGLSEAVNFSFVTPLLSAAEFREQYVAHPAPVGVPLPDTEFRLVDGEVWLRTPDVMRGYWEAPDATAEVLVEGGWLRTGDVGYLRDGLLVLRGRRGEVINRGGEKYYPVDVERRWRQAGLGGTFAVVPVPVDELGQDIGLVLDSGSVGDTRMLFDRATSVPPPAAVWSNGVLVTSTGKPRRTAMGRAMAVRRDSAPRYDDLLSYATTAARAIVHGPHQPASAQASRLYAHARALADRPTRPTSAAAGSGRVARSAAHDALDVLVDYWPRLADGSGTGVDMMRTCPGLWKRLMTEWPMGGYAALMADVLEARNLLRGRVLEVGSGVGNTTSRVAGRVEGEFVWSDRSADLVRRGVWPGRGVVLDFDRPPATELRGGGFTTILATNAVHCAADKTRTLRWLRSLLADGGTLVLAEGSNPTTTDGTPWALDFLFCAFDGWWDRGGFRTRWEWLALLERAGFGRLGYTALRARGHDLGGAVWGSRTGMDE